MNNFFKSILSFTIKTLYYNYIRIESKIKQRIRGFVILNYVKSHKGQVFVGGKTKLTRSTVLNHNPSFNGMIVSGGGEVVFGDNFHSGDDCLIITSFHNYDTGSKIPYDETYVNKDVIIEDNVWFGARVTVLGGVTIGEGAIIQAGAVVVKSVEPFGIAGGNPAKVFKYRDKEHYNKLKELGSFH
jgi:acetyltransferase-like isoleucine patch superfamily enzyme